MFGSNQSLPDTLSLQPLTFSYLPRAATCHHLLPQLPSPYRHPSPIPPTNAAFSQWSLTYFSTCFFPPRVMLALLYSLILHLIPAAAPHSGLPLGMACSEHCGVLKTAWSNVDEAWEAQSWVHVLNFCQMSKCTAVQCFLTNVCSDALLIFTFVATVER